tara:strand:+ start:109 stop:519 length:411 start_codon:yes stop_codon:yes gene_type:complete
MGEYPARIKEVSEEPEGQFGPQFKYLFEITNGEQEGVSLMGWTSQKFSAKSKMKQWVTAATQESFSAGDEFYPDSLVGKDVRIGVLKKVKDDGGEFNKIDSVLPPSISQKKAAQSTEATAGDNTVEEPLQEEELLF